MLITDEPTRCYTNNVLDQFLEHPVEVGIKKIIRVGGQSNSKELEGRNLRGVVKDLDKTRQEGNNIACHYSSLVKIQEEAGKLCLDLSRRPDSWAAVRDILKAEFPRLYKQPDI